MELSRVFILNQDNKELNTIPPPQGANPVGPDGIVSACLLCYSFLTQQWEAYETKRISNNRRMYWLKRFDNEPFAGLEQDKHVEQGFPTFWHSQLENVIDEIKLMLSQATSNKAMRLPCQGFTTPWGVATHQLGTPDIEYAVNIFDLSSKTPPTNSLKLDLAEQLPSIMSNVTDSVTAIK
ncbi:uncharacterized protein LOC143222658 [Tachypleus tridentatus]|uniref:uncharacterized protein LOC143222658 n=1 Tax=Tachypleus tridentatus TaxID=6853 RepID=UPI003FD3D9BF